MFAFLGALVVMYLTGQSLNEITLLALVLVAGILDDDVIVVVDNIQRKREEGLRGAEAILAGASEVFWPLLAASATTIGAFLPLLLMTGTTGEFCCRSPSASPWRSRCSSACSWSRPTSRTSTAGSAPAASGSWRAPTRHAISNAAA
jgi:hypothetical protein